MEHDPTPIGYGVSAQVKGDLITLTTANDDSVIQLTRWTLKNLVQHVSETE